MGDVNFRSYVDTKRHALHCREAIDISTAGGVGTERIGHSRYGIDSVTSVESIPSTVTTNSIVHPLYLLLNLNSLAPGTFPLRSQINHVNY